MSEILEVSHLFPIEIKDAYTMLETWNGNHRSAATGQVIRTLEEGNTMERYPYEYDRYHRSMAGKPQAGTMQKPKPPKPMPKVRALALVDTLKKSLVVASLAAFVSFGGLAAFHQVSTTTTKAASASTTSTSSTQKNSKNFLKQSRGNTSGASSSSSGTSSGISSSSSSSSGTSSSSSSSQGTSSGTGSATGSSSPVSGTHVS